MGEEKRLTWGANDSGKKKIRQDVKFHKIN
jgi:hypothetical protein